MPSDNGFIPLCEPFLDGNEWAYVKDCLDTGWISSVGSYVDRFERAVAERTGRAHGIAAVNGTSALHAALLAVGVKPGDEVLVSSLTFIAPVNAIRYAGAHPVFIDAEEAHWQIDPEAARVFLEEQCEPGGEGLRRRATGRRVAAILPVHVLGHPADIGRIVELARRHGLRVVEDATEALGSRYRGEPVGSHGDVACFSFNGNKILTTGGGGVIVTGDQSTAARARYLTTQAKDDPVEYIHHEIGYNYRLTNVLAAIGCAQMENLDRYVERKKEIARTYDAAFAVAPGVSGQLEAPWAESNRWLYTIRLGSAAARPSRELMAALRAREIQTRPLWQPSHLSRAHQQDRPGWPMPVSETLNRECLSLPCSVSLSPGQQAKVIAEITAAVERRVNFKKES